MTKLYRRILRELEELAAMSRDPEQTARRAERVSAWCVGEQLEHLVKSDAMILDGVEAALAGSVESAGGRPTLVGRLALLLGFIPRGRGKAPARSRPERIAPDEIRSGFEQVERRVRALEPELHLIERLDWTYAHHVLGNYTAAEWLRFIAVHHRHHMKIIRDICKAA